MSVALPATLLPYEAAAVQTAQSKVVSADPANWTPNVLDGSVKAIVQAGSTILLGGEFTKVSSADGKTVYDRSNIVAFDATTGAISTSFAPKVDDEVTSLALSSDGKSVYAGGFFNTVNGTASRSLARINLSDGKLTSGFKAPTSDGRVKDIRLAGGRLWISGNFANIAGHKQAALATLDPTTGAYSSFEHLAVAGPLNGGALQITKMDISPDGSRLVAIGNFSTVEGQQRSQIAMLDLTGSAAKLANWQTNFYTSICNPVFDTYMRDLDFAPDGSYFVVTTTGGWQGGPPKSCDSAARFETGASGSALTPTWVDYTGGDTFYAAAVTGTAIYVGGHFRWHNNPTVADQAGPGAVSRDGIATLDPANGLPLKWNPTRTRGVGVFDLLATSQGLWMGSDTDRVGNWEYHARIAFFPLAGGSDVPRPPVGAVPGDVYLVPTGASPSPIKRHYDGTTVGSSAAVPAGGLTWSNVKAGFMLGDQLYAGWSDGTFNRRTFNGSSYGSPTAVNTADKIVVDSAWHGDVTAATGMFFADGRIYYTKTGDGNLYYRGFNIESDVVGQQRLTASPSIAGVDFSKVSGMFVAGGKLYFGSAADGNLRRVDFVGGKPTGAATVVSGPGVDGIDWRSRATFLFTKAGVAANEAPEAVISANCDGLDCAFTSIGSRDPDGTISSYAWDFGDGATATSRTPSHTFASAGNHTVKLTVTDADGVTATAQQSLAVSAPNQAPAAKFSVSCDGLACTFDGSSSADADGTVSSYAWSFGDGATATGAKPSHTFAAAGGHAVKLTVTDNDAATGQAQDTVSVASPGTAVRFAAQAGANANTSKHTVTIPTTVAAGDRLLLLFTANSTTPTVSAPSGVTGWSAVGTKSTTGTSTRVWQKAAAPTDAGKSVTVTLSSAVKGDLTVVAYRGPHVVLQSFADRAETASRSTHTTPSVTGNSGAWLVSYWGEESASTTAWTAPSGQTVRRTGFGTGPGHVSALLTDSSAPAGVGTRGALTATANTSSAQATMWSFVIGPAG
ncbi:MAG TPA: PKD domain-containing protein [Actinopolymorphaceae bacterium]|nr:PKD domain-containing protein [Actinopolymorphaceae bacterium]